LKEYLDESIASQEGHPVECSICQSHVRKA